MIFGSYTFPNGSITKNRLVKAAMEENLAADNRSPSTELIDLYQRWSKGGVGLIITGNVMIDHRHMTGPGGLVLENHHQLDVFTRWAKAAQHEGTQVWMQINHPGRQTPASISTGSIAPSAIPVNMGKLSKMFAPPRAMTEADIHEVIERFARTAKLAEQAGFNGVEIHAAHGYLLSQFLSPLTNQRHDRWGGTLENRARLLIEVIRAVRQRVSKTFAVAVKINSADFQRGGFQPEDALSVAKMLENEAVDLLELSGGSYEAPAMQGDNRDERTLAREAYFLTFAKDIARATQLPVMTTGGIYRYATAETVIKAGIDLVGMGTALALNPELPNTWQSQSDHVLTLKPLTWKNKSLAALGRMALIRQMLKAHAGTHKIKKPMPYWFALIRDQWHNARNTRRLNQWRQERQQR